MRPGRIAVSVLVFATCTVDVGVGAGTVGLEPGPDRPNPVLARFHEDIRFYLSFDGEQHVAEIAGGAQQPRVDGDLRFADGVSGRALAGGALNFKGPGNIDLGAAGTALVWVAVERWNVGDDEPYFWPLRIGTDRGMLLLGRQGALAKGRRRATFYAYAKAGGRETSLHLGSPDAAWRGGEWQMLAMNWRLGLIEFSVNGAPASSRAIENVGQAAWFLVGHKRHSAGVQVLIDEVMIFERRLTDAELAWIYKTTKR